jgi:hypothetical protein
MPAACMRRSILGWVVRKRRYNFHHVLNHLNLFGDGHLAQAEGVATTLLGELPRMAPIGRWVDG